MNTKLHINIQQGIIDVEGEREFVEQIYKDFQSQVIKHFGESAAAPEAGRQERKGDSGKKGRSKGEVSSKTSAAKGQKYKPKFLPNLPLKDLKKFCSNYEPKYNFERIVIFCKYLETALSKNSFTADEIYSCFYALRSEIKIPKAFEQALRVRPESS